MVLDDEESVANWMIEFERSERVKQGIACPELEYPSSMARFPRVKDWEEYYGKDWYDYVSENA